MFDCGRYIDRTVDLPWGANLTNYCNTVADGGPFNYGIYKNAITTKIASHTMSFSKTYFYSLWVGLLSLRYSLVPSAFPLQLATQKPVFEGIH